MNDNKTTGQMMASPLPKTSKVIIEAIVGSTVHGTAVDDGLEDLDLLQVAVENQKTYMAFNVQPDGGQMGNKDNWVWRTKPEGVRSQAGDVDLVRHGLRKYLGLVLNCNPSMLLLLFVPKDKVRYQTELGEELQAMTSHIISRRAFNTFGGYMHEQYERMIGTRGQKNCTRQELVDKYGFDTKYAGHVIRLGMQGKEILLTGKISLPLRDEERRIVVDVRTGKYSLEEVCQMALKLESDLRQANEQSILPRLPNHEYVNNWMLATYRQHWNGELDL